MNMPERYFEQDEDGIRLKGHRLWLEHLLSLSFAGMTPEQIVGEYPTVTLEEVEAAIAYYQAHRAEMDAYLERQRVEAEARERASGMSPSPRIDRLKALLEERHRSQSGATTA